MRHTETGGAAADPPAVARVAATVGRRDGAKGFVLTPADGGAEVSCPVSTLRAVGLEFLIEGALVTCETAPGAEGAEVVRILAVEFPTAGVDEARDAAPAARPASGQAVRARVKRFLETKGYGFLEPEDGSEDIFCHASAVWAAGRDTLHRGAVVTCQVEAGARSRQVARILAVEDPPADMPAEGRLLRGEVKFYDAARGFGFVVPDDGGADVFVHLTALSGSGLDGLDAGQRVGVRAVDGPRGPQAVEVELIGDGAG